MAGFAYLLLPLSGLVAFVTGGSVRVRFHGLQAIVFGTIWVVGLYAASAIAAGATVVVSLGGAVVWLLLGSSAALGRDPRLPLVGRLLWEVATPQR